MEVSNIVDDEMVNNDYLVNKANFIDRVKSSIIDSFVVIALLYLVSLLFDEINLQSTNVKMVSFVLIFMYEPILTSINKTFGQRIMKIRVVKESSLANPKSNPKRINIIFSVIRYVFKIILGWLSLLTIHSDKYGRAIHDRIVSSVMVRD